MVCEKCEQKLSKCATQSPWRSSARNSGESSSRKIGENKLLSTKKDRFQPYKGQQFVRCRTCKTVVHQMGSHYCQGCAYKVGICAMCGKKIHDTTRYRQSQV